MKPTGYAAGTDHVTLADLAFAATVSNIVGGEMVDMAPYPDLMAWLTRFDILANWDAMANKLLRTCLSGWRRR